MSKICTKCCRSLSEEFDFYFVKGGLTSQCKDCYIRYSKAYQKKNGSSYKRMNDQQKARYKAYQKAYYIKNKKKMDYYAKRYRQEHPDYYREYCAARKKGLYPLRNRQKVDEA